MSTFKDAQRIIADLGLTLKKTEYDEYRVNFKGGREATAYYTNDLQDAIDTAAAMQGKQEY